MDFDLQACIEGDNDAWNAFCDQTAGLVLAAIRRTMPVGRTPSGAEIDDVIQAVYVKLLRHDCRLLRSYDPARSAMSTWITLIARSVAIDALRRKALDTQPLSEEIRHAASPGPPRDGPTMDLPLHLLTDRQRLVLNMLYQDDLDVAEAAAVLGVNEQTIRSTKHKALERLRAHFKTAGQGDALSAEDV